MDRLAQILTVLGEAACCVLIVGAAMWLPGILELVFAP